MSYLRTPILTTDGQNWSSTTLDYYLFSEIVHPTVLVTGEFVACETNDSFFFTKLNKYETGIGVVVSTVFCLVCKKYLKYFQG